MDRAHGFDRTVTIFERLRRDRSRADTERVGSFVGIGRRIVRRDGDVERVSMRWIEYGRPGWDHVRHGARHGVRDRDRSVLGERRVRAVDFWYVTHVRVTQIMEEENKKARLAAEEDKIYVKFASGDRFPIERKSTGVTKTASGDEFDVSDANTAFAVYLIMEANRDPDTFFF